MKPYAHKSIAVLALIGASAIPLAGCEMLSEQNGMSRPAATGAVTGATAGGIIALIANANPAWVAASVVLGGVTGGVIGDALGKEDAEKHASTNLSSLDTLGPGQSQRWSNAKTGNSGSTTVHTVNRASDGTVCKTYTETVTAGAQTTSRDGRVCRAPGGAWAMQSG